MDETPSPPDEEAIARRLREAAERARRTADQTGGAGTDAARIERLEARMEDAEPLAPSEGDEGDFEARLRAVEAKAAVSRQRREATATGFARDRSREQEDARGTGVGLSAAYALMGLPLAGAALGYGLNRWTGGNAWLPILTIAGGIAGIWYVARLTNRP